MIIRLLLLSLFAASSVSASIVDRVPATAPVSQVIDGGPGPVVASDAGPFLVNGQRIGVDGVPLDSAPLEGADGHAVPWNDGWFIVNPFEGELYVTPAPTLRHQDIVFRLALRLQSILVEPGHGRLWMSPVGVEFPESGEGVQPDIVFVSSTGRATLTESVIRGAPHLVIEVLSPTTADRDRGVKRKLYERQGVEQYWIVDPDSETIEAWTFGERPSEAPSLRRYVERLPVYLGAAAIGEIDLEKIFREP